MLGHIRLLSLRSLPPCLSIVFCVPPSSNSRTLNFPPLITFSRVCLAHTSRALLSSVGRPHDVDLKLLDHFQLSPTAVQPQLRAILMRALTEKVPTRGRAAALFESGWSGTFAGIVAAASSRAEAEPEPEPAPAPAPALVPEPPGQVAGVPTASQKEKPSQTILAGAKPAGAKGGAAAVGAGVAAAADAVRLSKSLSHLLRHGSEKAGLRMEPDGFVRLAEALALPKLRRWSVEDVRKVVESCTKQRFALRTDEAGAEWIRANQGHTIRSVTDEALLTEITEPTELPTAVHGTYRAALPAIEAVGLSRMSRNHIHFAVGMPDGAEVISGMRASAEVVIYLDVAAAMAAGIRMYRSANNVVLSPGNASGHIPPEYFAAVEQRRELTGASATLSAPDPIASMERAVITGGAGTDSRGRAGKHVGKPPRSAGIIALAGVPMHVVICRKENGKASFPKGGLGGQTVQAAAVREWMEETDLSSGELEFTGHWLDEAYIGCRYLVARWRGELRRGP